MSTPFSKPLAYMMVPPSGENAGELFIEPAGTRPSSGFAAPPPSPFKSRSITRIPSSVMTAYAMRLAFGCQAG